MKLSLLALLVFACSHPKQQVETPQEPIAKRQDSTENKTVEQALDEIKPKPEIPCQKLLTRHAPPVQITGQPLVITKISQPCQTKDGDPGYLPGSSWMVMGFPCTGGDGRFNYKGNYAVPKIVEMVVPNSCPMAPGTTDQVAETIGRQVLPGAAARPLAFYPFALQFWELLDYPDADTGFVVKLRSPDSRQNAWRHFVGGKPIRVRFYGRENAWGRGEDLYVANVVLKKSGEAGFQVEVVDVSVVEDATIISQARSKCERIRAVATCSQIFSH